MGNLEKNIMEQLKARKEQLNKILHSSYPVAYTESSFAAHERKLANAKVYLAELEELCILIDSDAEAKLVPLPTLDKQIAKADFAAWEMDEIYCKAVVINNYPFDGVWLIYMAPLTAL